MEEAFHESQHLTKEVLRTLQKRENKKGLLHFALQFSLMWGSATLVFLYYDQVWWKWLPAFFVYALMVLPMFAVGHETIHKTAFSSSALNTLVCWLACIPIYYVPEIFRRLHFAHHRHTQDPERDPEISIGGKPAPSVVSSFFMYMSFLSGIPLFLYKIVMMIAGAFGHTSFVWKRIFYYVHPKQRNRIRWDSRALLLFHMGFVWVAWMYFPGLWLLIAGQVLGHCILSVVLTAEHNGLAHKGTIFERTRTTHTHGFIRFLMWNMPYHAEHHAYPAVPWHALPQLHVYIQQELQHEQKGYTDFHQNVLTSLLQGKAFVSKSSNTKA